MIGVFVTLATVVIAATLGRAMWRAYVDTPWTRDATVRAYVVTMAPEVFGRIVELRVSDNQFVHKGDLLMVIDPTDYRIALSRTSAALRQAELDAENATRLAERRESLAKLDAVALEQAPVGLEGLEIVVALLVGDVGHQRGPQADVDREKNRSRQARIAASTAHRSSRRMTIVIV